MLIELQFIRCQIECSATCPDKMRLHQNMWRTYDCYMVLYVIYTYCKMEDPCIRLGEALVGWHHLHKELGVHGQTGQSCQQPTVT